MRREVLVVGSFGPPRSHAHARAKRRDRRSEGFDFRSPPAGLEGQPQSGREPAAGGVTDRSRVCSGFASICRSRRAASVPERFAGGCGHRGAEGSSQGSETFGPGRKDVVGAPASKDADTRALALSSAEGTPNPTEAPRRSRGSGGNGARSPDSAASAARRVRRNGIPGVSEARPLRAPSEENTGCGRSDGGSKRMKRREARHPPDCGLARRHGTSARSSGARL